MSAVLTDLSPLALVARLPQLRLFSRYRCEAAWLERYVGAG